MENAAPDSGPIGLLGGTFDPIHYGHLFAAQEVAERFGLERVILIPCGSAPHKDPSGVLSAEHRYEMCCLAAADNPLLDVSRIEIDRDGPSYAFDTITHYLAQRDPEDLHYIVGTDAFALIETWFRYSELLQLCTILVVRRPGSGMAPGRARRDAHRLHYLEIEGVEVSSSGIRRRVAEGRSVRYLVPECVDEYIAAHRLYVEPQAEAEQRCIGQGSATGHGCE